MNEIFCMTVLICTTLAQYQGEKVFVEFKGCGVAFLFVIPFPSRINKVFYGLQKLVIVSNYRILRMFCPMRMFSAMRMFSSM